MIIDPGEVRLLWPPPFSYTSSRLVIKPMSYTQIKNGLWNKKHAKQMGESWILFGKYLSYRNAPKSTKSINTNELCVIVYPDTIAKQLDIDKETWRSYHQNLVNSGYISSNFLDNSEALVVCIKKAML